MNILLPQELKNAIMQIRGGTRVTLETITKVKMVKKHRETGEANPYYERVYRVAERSGMVNVNYENAVNLRRGQETPVGEYMTEFKAEALWNGAGEHVSVGIVRHKVKGTEYLVFYPNHDDEGLPTTKNSRYLLRGDHDQYIDEELVKPYFAVVSVNKRQEVERPVPWRTIALDSILTIKCMGQESLIVHRR